VNCDVRPSCSPQKAPGLGAELLEVVAYCEGGKFDLFLVPNHVDEVGINRFPLALSISFTSKRNRFRAFSNIAGVTCSHHSSVWMD